MSKIVTFFFLDPILMKSNKYVLQKIKFESLTYLINRGEFELNFMGFERNYEELNSKIDDIASKRRNNEMQNIDPVAGTKDWAQLKPEILDAIKQDAQPAVF